MSAGISYALSRLKKKQIFCISPQRINVAGKLRVMCFDKTGTLTEDDLSVHGVQEVKKKNQTLEFKRMKMEMTNEAEIEDEELTISHPTPSNIGGGKNGHSHNGLNTECLLAKGLASCHSVAKINGNYVGDPMDVQMLQFTGWKLVENYKTKKSEKDGIKKDDDDEEEEEDLGRQLTESEFKAREERKKKGAEDQKFSKAVLDSCDRKEFLTDHVQAVVCPPKVTKENPKEGKYVAIHRRFDFQSHLQRMSVIVREEGNVEGSYDIFVKGSPEILATLCLSSTIPSSFGDVLATYTRKGLRVLAVAHRVLSRGALLSTGSQVVVDLLSSSKTTMLTEDEIDKLPRADVERDLTFIGFLIMENKLRPSTRPTIERLNEGCIKTVMVTGDNALTAVNVARNCGIIPSYIEEELDNTKKKVKAHIKEIPVFMSEISDEEEREERLIWRCTDDPSLILDNETLFPIYPVEQCSTTLLLPSLKNTNKNQLNDNEYSERNSVKIPPLSETSSEASQNYGVSLINVPSTVNAYVDVITTIKNQRSDKNSVSSKKSNLSSVDSNMVNEQNNGETSSVSLSSSISTESGRGRETPSFKPAKEPSIRCWNGGPWGGAYFMGRALPENFPKPPKLVISGEINDRNGSLSLASCTSSNSSNNVGALPPYFLAVTGAAFRKLKAEDDNNNPNSVFKKVVYLSSVFARMSPSDKASLVESLTDLGYITGMCGDGANDCGALKAAHVGISLSEVEASIAAPFTSKIASIECVEHVLLEGRSSLATSFQEFKTVAAFSMIQFSTSIFLLGYDTMLTDFQFLAIDILITLPFLMFIGYTGAAKKMTHKTPLGSLISFPVISSLLIHTLMTCAVQAVALFVLQKAYDFTPLPIDNEDYDTHLISYETTGMFFTSLYHYFFSGVVLSLYDPFLRIVITNPLLMLGMVFSLFMCLFFTFIRIDWLDELMQNKITEDSMMYIFMLVSGLLYGIILCFFEYGIAQPNLLKKIMRKLRPRSKLKGKVTSVSEKEKKALMEEKLKILEVEWERARNSEKEHDDDDDVLMDPSIENEKGADNSKKENLLHKDCFIVSEEMKKEISDSIPSTKTVYRKPYYALLNEMYEYKPV
jgi:cation-transporting ATPase 13A3/4/5